jgi:hypothetical protein
MSHAPSTTPSSSTPPLMHSWQSSRGPSESPLPPLNPSPAITGGTFGYDDLAAATDGFSDANLLGQGGFGHVYRGTLGGHEVAIKKLRAGSGQGDREFRAEVEIISRVHHKNLVSLAGYCLYGEQRLLVYEYVPNKTLEFHLHGKNALPKRIYLLNTTKKKCISSIPCNGRLRPVVQTFEHDIGAWSQGADGRRWTGRGGGRLPSARLRVSPICMKIVSSWLLATAPRTELLNLFCLPLTKNGLVLVCCQVILKLSIVTSRRRTSFWITTTSQR